MAENKNTDFGTIEKLALIAESLQNLFEGKATVVFELKKEEYSAILSKFRDMDKNNKQFSIDISGTEFHFLFTEDES